MLGVTWPVTRGTGRSYPPLLVLALAGQCWAQIFFTLFMRLGSKRLPVTAPIFVNVDEGNCRRFRAIYTPARLVQIRHRVRRFGGNCSVGYCLPNPHVKRLPIAKHMNSRQVTSRIRLGLTELSFCQEGRARQVDREGICHQKYHQSILSCQSPLNIIQNKYHRCEQH